MPVLEITTMAGCPLSCSFCPQDKLKSAYGKGNKYLALEQFKAVLRKIPPHVQIDFSGMSEPWANPEATEMLSHALQRGHSIAVYTTLYGMTLDDADRTIDLLSAHRERIKIFCLHLPDRAGNMRGWKHSSEHETVLKKFLDFGKRGILRKFEAMTMDEHGAVHKDLEHLGITLGKWTGISRAGSLDVAAIGGQKLHHSPRNANPVSCASTPDYDHNVMLPNGDVVLCCMDYSLKHVIGNLFEQDYEELFASAEMDRIRAGNAAAGYSKCTICKSCDNVLQHGYGFLFSAQGVRQTVRRLHRWAAS